MKFKAEIQSSCAHTPNAVYLVGDDRRLYYRSNAGGAPRVVVNLAPNSTRAVADLLRGGAVDTITVGELEIRRVEK